MPGKALRVLDYNITKRENFWFSRYFVFSKKAANLVEQQTGHSFVSNL